jgi:hypothetical protein
VAGGIKNYRGEIKMNPRVEYEMTEEDLNKILDACKPVTCMMIGGFTQSSPQENANRAWAELGKRMGFDSMSVRPSNKGLRFFSAIPSETESQKSERINREKEAKRQADIQRLASEIASREKELNDLLAEGE